MQGESHFSSEFGSFSLVDYKTFGSKWLSIEQTGARTAWAVRKLRGPFREGIAWEGIAWEGLPWEGIPWEGIACRRGSVRLRPWRSTLATVLYHPRTTRIACLLALARPSNTPARPREPSRREVDLSRAKPPRERAMAACSH